MQFNKNFICIVSKPRHICYIFAIFSHTFYLFILFIFFIFIQKSHQPDENVLYIFIGLMAFSYEQMINVNCLIRPNYKLSVNYTDNL